MWHKLVLVGYLGRDPELRYTPDGDAVADFSVAVSDGFGDNRSTIWFKVTAWRKRAETCAQYLKKGSRVLVEGRIKANKYGSPNVWQGENGPRANFEVTASDVRFLSSKDEVDSGGDVEAGVDEEIPF